MPKESLAFSSSRLEIDSRQNLKIGEKITLNWKFPSDICKIQVHSTGIKNITNWVHSLVKPILIKHSFTAYLYLFVVEKD